MAFQPGAFESTAFYITLIERLHKLVIKLWNRCSVLVHTRTVGIFSETHNYSSYTTYDKYGNATTIPKVRGDEDETY